MILLLYMYGVSQLGQLDQFFFFFGIFCWDQMIIPINIFLAGEFSPYQNWLKTFTTKDVKMIFGPTTSLNNIVRKRNKRRQIQLVKKTDR